MTSEGGVSILLESVVKTFQFRDCQEAGPVECHQEKSDGDRDRRGDQKLLSKLCEIHDGRVWPRKTMDSRHSLSP